MREIIFATSLVEWRAAVFACSNAFGSGGKPGSEGLTRVDVGGNISSTTLATRISVSFFQGRLAMASAAASDFAEPSVAIKIRYVDSALNSWILGRTICTEHLA